MHHEALPGNCHVRTKFARHRSRNPVTMSAAQRDSHPQLFAISRSRLSSSRARGTLPTHYSTLYSPRNTDHTVHSGRLTISRLHTGHSPNPSTCGLAHFDRWRGNHVDLASHSVPTQLQPHQSPERTCTIKFQGPQNVWANQKNSRATIFDKPLFGITVRLRIFIRAINGDARSSAGSKCARHRPKIKKGLRHAVFPRGPPPQY